MCLESVTCAQEYKRCVFRCCVLSVGCRKNKRDMPTIRGFLLNAAAAAEVAEAAAAEAAAALVGHVINGPSVRWRTRLSAHSTD